MTALNPPVMPRENTPFEGISRKMNDFQLQFFGDLNDKSSYTREPIRLVGHELTGELRT